jgi:hypothetical protein
MAESPRIEALRAQARYHRERLDLYRAKMYGLRPTTMTRLRELERIDEAAEARLRGAEQERASFGVEAGHEVVQQSRVAADGDEAVRHAGRHSDLVADAQATPMQSDEELDLALDDAKDLGLPGVDVRRQAAT